MTQILGITIPESLEGNSYISEMLVYDDFGMFDEAILCLEEGIKGDNDNHTFKLLLGRVHAEKHGQLNLLDGAAGLASPAPESSRTEANNETYCNEK